MTEEITRAEVMAYVKLCRKLLVNLFQMSHKVGDNSMSSISSGLLLTLHQGKGTLDHLQEIANLISQYAFQNFISEEDMKFYDECKSRGVNLQGILDEFRNEL